ncbi:hypothetical protein [Streptomyces sp. NPDC058657]|uniref:hypothetical protein n=1 Tax=unclassified Streptomyces TaxID=2593676 RepID=UPI00364C3486
MTEARRAALAIANHSHNADDCRALLDMLGLSAVLATQARQHDGIRHGTPYAYTKGGCRCDDCREANRKRCQASRQRSAADPSRADRAGHGKASTYKNHGCRCAECSAANTADVSAYRARRRVKARA